MTYSQLIVKIAAEERRTRTRHRLHRAVSDEWRRGPVRGRVRGSSINNSTWNVPETAALYGARVCVG